MAMPLLNFSCMVVSNSSLEYGKVTTIVTTNFEFAGAAGGEGAGVVGNGVEGVFKLPTEGLVSAEGGGVVVAVVVDFQRHKAHKPSLRHSLERLRIYRDHNPDTMLSYLHP